MKYIGMKSVVFMTVLAATSSAFAATPVRAPELQFLGGEHGWASCRYQAFIELKPGVSSSLQIFVRQKRFGPTGVRLETSAGAKPGIAPTVRLLAPGSAALLDIRLSDKGDTTTELPPDAVIAVLDALMQRNDLILEVSDGGVTEKIPATPASYGNAKTKSDWEHCLKYIDDII